MTGNEYEDISVAWDWNRKGLDSLRLRISPKSVLVC